VLVCAPHAPSAECEALEGELVPNLLRLHMNSITVLHSDVEDYVTYDTLPHFLPGAPAIYPPNDPHRTRAGGGGGYPARCCVPVVMSMRARVAVWPCGCMVVCVRVCAGSS
jgi:hypothetical protein